MLPAEGRISTSRPNQLALRPPPASDRHYRGWAILKIPPSQPSTPSRAHGNGLPAIRPRLLGSGDRSWASLCLLGWGTSEKRVPHGVWLGHPHAVSAWALV